MTPPLAPPATARPMSAPAAAPPATAPRFRARVEPAMMESVLAAIIMSLPSTFTEERPITLLRRPRRADRARHHAARRDHDPIAHDHVLLDGAGPGVAGLRRLGGDGARDIDLDRRPGRHHDGRRFLWGLRVGRRGRGMRPGGR